MNGESNGTWKNYNFSTQDSEYFRKLFVAKRKILVSRMIAGALSQKDKVAHKRRAKSIIRHKIVKLKRRLKSTQIDISEKNKKYSIKESYLLDTLYPKRQQKWVAYNKRSKKIAKDINIGELSFHNNPSETMRQLLQLVKADAKIKKTKVNYRDGVCGDVGPYLVLAAMYKSLNRIFTGGKITRNLSRLFDALEVDKHLSIKLKQNEANPFEISAFKIRSGTGRSKKDSPMHLTGKQLINKTNRELIAEINKWLAGNQEELTLEGRRVVGKLVAETLDNAERHSEKCIVKPDIGDWYVSGALIKFPNMPLRRIHLSFLSVGNTIASSMEKCADATREKMQDYVNCHRHCMGKYGEEQLKTVFALQDGVTSSSAAFLDNRGGTGFQDICDFFEGMALAQGEAANANFTILSGNTVIHLKAPYMKGVVEQGDERELWFNKNNTKEEPPEKSHVTFTDYPLGGTILTMSFDLKPGLVEKGHDKNDYARKS